MINKIKKIALAIAAGLVLGNSFFADAEVLREHRAIWATPYLSGNWPSSKITEANADQLKRVLENRMSIIGDQNINVIYYHVRSECDAMYNSAYEPWSETVSGTRGVAPAFDPFEFFVQTAHANGIEVYAWVNPYRYNANSATGGHGAGELNYENSHPEWLVSGSSVRCLNPGIEDVTQRILDVCKDSLTKYDVDGIVFDDYFYPSGIKASEDATQYNAYKSAGGTLSLDDWRRDNVNQMVRRVGEMIKATKPYVRFGISPAGCANPPTVTSEYGLPAAPGIDWQYAQIYSDPLNWLKNGYIDYISPQVYADVFDFEPLTGWWANAAIKFGRHLYTSASGIDSEGFDEMITEMNYSREVSPENTAGVVYFHWQQFVNTAENRVKFGDKMKETVFQTKVLAPLRPWNNTTNPQMVSNVVLDGTSLTWNAVEGARYTVYAVPESMADAQFGCQREYLEAICYTNSFTVPKDKTSGYRWAVCVYDRQGNEYSPLFAGASAATISAAALTGPVKGAVAPDLFSFKWEGTGSRFIVEVAEDEQFSHMVGSIETYTNDASISSLPPLTTGKTYYWRVVSVAANAPAVTSAAESFVASRITVESPANDAENVSLTPVVSWSAAESGSTYLLEISDREDFLNVFYSTETNTTSTTLPECTLSSYCTYYARVTATLDGCSSTSEIATFKTLEQTYDNTPTIAKPLTDGETIYSNEKVKVNPWSGYKQVKVQISSSASFPTRNSKTITLSNFECETKELSSYSLANGTAYYVRAYGEYAVSTSSSLKKTGYSPVLTFVYNSEAGIDNVGADAETVFIADDVLVLSGYKSSVDIYTVSGQLIDSVEASEDYDLSHLASGIFVIKVATDAGVKTFKYVK